MRLEIIGCMNGSSRRIYIVQGNWIKERRCDSDSQYVIFELGKNIWLEIS